MAVKNWGKMERIEHVIPALEMFQIDENAEPIIIKPAETVWLQGQDGVTWWNMTKDIPRIDGQWFIAVQDNGWIMCCEKDPDKVMLWDVDIWQIEHPGPREAIIAHKWTGDSVVEFDYENPA